MAAGPTRNDLIEQDNLRDNLGNSVQTADTAGQHSTNLQQQVEGLLEEVMIRQAYATFGTHKPTCMLGVTQTSGSTCSTLRTC